MSVRRVALQCFFIASQLLFVLPAHSQQDNESSIAVIQVRLAPVGSQSRLSALFDVVLSRDMRQGLDSGVPLHFIMNVQIKQAKPYWPDKTLLAIERRFSLTYYELTRHYRLQAVDTQKSRNFRSLSAAVEALGQIPSILLTLPDAVPLVGHVSMQLDENFLPLPLKSLFSSTWRIASEEYVWPIE